MARRLGRGRRKHFFDGPDTRDGLFRKWEGQSDGAGEFPIDIDRAAAHPLHDAGFGQGSTGKASENQRLPGSDIVENAQNFDLKFLDFPAFEHRPADCSLAGVDNLKPHNTRLRPSAAHPQGGAT